MLQERPLAHPVVAVGGDIKCIPALGRGNEVRFGEDVGDLAHPEGQDRLRRAVEEMIAEAGGHCVIACDRHPRYFSGRVAREAAERHRLRLIEIQHHRAHVAAVVAEHRLEETVVGLAFDGTGYGDDDVIWGGEFFVGSVDAGFRRLAHFAPLRLLGGDAAVREPWRVALGALLDRGRDEDAVLDWMRRVGAPAESFALFRRGLARGVNVATTTALGRWFDCASALLGACVRVEREAQAAIELEQEAAGDEAEAPPGYSRIDERDGRRIIDLPGLFDASLRGAVDIPHEAAVFHAAAAEAAVEVAAALARESGARAVVAGGGCFLNRILCARMEKSLTAAGLEWRLPKSLPPGDQALALGQIVLAGRAAVKG